MDAVAPDARFRVRRQGRGAEVSVNGIRLQLRDGQLMVLGDGGQPVIAAALKESLSVRLRLSTGEPRPMEAGTSLTDGFEP
ncbi:hypothetical protein GI374_03180 [Paracoccus sp. S-4012]|uniref:hypothetical protein n=1 Tax=Paracoccus sp. S-4012 TaxID=2665648 RepID=UPI0012B031E1|nr:hypothetical protein [Paracoccus sp. S-4012]MRX49464.1 hypothetical protein [Paracoccus sp. S-4012]